MGEIYFIGKYGGIIILYDISLQFQIAPKTLLYLYPRLQSRRFIYGILSTETGPTIHFMSVYGFTGIDIYIEAQQNNNTFFSSVFDYVSSFGNVPI